MTNPADVTAPSPAFRTRVPATVLAIAAVAMIGLSAGWSPQPRAIDAVQVVDGFADESRCADCHEQAETFWETGHARTLQPASSKVSMDSLRQMTQNESLKREQTHIEFEDGRPVAITKSDDVTRTMELDWCFGSGEHARTWLATMNDSMGATDSVEFRWSWFHDGEQFALTPAQPDEPMHGAYGKLGVFFDGPKARRCFSCHSLSVPGEGAKIDEAHIIAGVTCQRCHGPRAAHVASEGAVKNENWRTESRADAIDRCAQCHRRAEDQEPDTITTDNVNIVRFQPIGLVQSACFTQSEMTCVTCHDPHKPLSQQDSRGIWQCVQCHSPEQSEHATCADGNVDACLRCHMPKVRMTAPVSFTDHWIRVRDEIDATP